MGTAEARIYGYGKISGLRRHIARLLLLAVVMLPGTASAANQAPSSGSSGLAIISPAGRLVTLTVAQLRAMPAVTVNADFGTDHGPFKAVFSGPLLWVVLQDAAAVDPKQPKLAVQGSILITGSDGYSALLALSEIAPLFEGKQVILATAMNGKRLGAQHLRIVVPGDVKGGRSVRDVVSIAVSVAGSPHPGANRQTAPKP